MSASDKQPVFKTKGADSAPKLLDAFPLPVLDVDLNGSFIDANPAACRLFRLERRKLLGRREWDFTSSDQSKFSHESFFAMLNKPGEPDPIRCAFCDDEGGFHTCDMYRCYLYAENGQRVAVRYVLVDVTVDTAITEDSCSALAWNESLLASLPEAVIASDPLGFIVYVNPAAERLIGWTAKELEGKPLEKTLPLVDQATGDQAIQAIETALERSASAETLLLDSEGRQSPIEIRSAPWVDKETGSTAGVISILRRLDRYS